MTEEIIFPDDDRARMNGATHFKCNTCGAAVNKYQKVCLECERKEDDKTWDDYEKTLWDGQFSVYSVMYDRLFFNKEDVIDFMNKMSITEKQLRLVVCKKARIEKVVFEDLAGFDYDDSIHCTYDWTTPDEIQNALNMLNNLLDHIDTGIWEETTVAARLD